MQDIDWEPRECLNRFELSKLMENIDLYNFAFFVSGGFSNLSRAVDKLEGSGARQSMQNDLAHLSESARLL